MSQGLLFWIIMLLWLLFGLGAYFGPEDKRPWANRGFSLMTFILFLLLGWHAYGPPVN